MSFRGIVLTLFAAQTIAIAWYARHLFTKGTSLPFLAKVPIATQKRIMLTILAISGYLTLGLFFANALPGTIGVGSATIGLLLIIAGGLFYMIDPYKLFLTDPAPEPEPVPEPPPAFLIPYDLRNEHVHVVAATGHGKSQLFLSMIRDDFEHDNAIVVIDSQNDLINTIATRVPLERLVLIDPVHCPPGLNLFALSKNQTSLSLIEYMFNSHDAQLTSKQAMCFRFLGRAIIEKGGNIYDLITYLQHPEQAPTTSTNQAAAAFFAEYQKPKGQFSETRQEILRRVLTVLENETMQEMLTSELRINIGKEMAAGKVILINTAKPQMGGQAATLFGRFFIAQIIQAVMQGSRKRVHLYLDEFQDYAEDSEIMQTLFTQSRKYNLGMVVAHQSLSQLPEGLRPTIVTNTAIKLVGSVSPDDRASLGKQINFDPKNMEIPKGLFWLWVRGSYVRVFATKFGEFEKLQKLSVLSFVQSRMRELYGVPSPTATTTPQKPLQETPEQGRGDQVDEKGTW